MDESLRPSGKKLRDRVLGGPRAQRAVRRAIRYGLLPEMISGRIQPIGPHPIRTPGGQAITYVADAQDVLARNVIWVDGWESASLELFSKLSREAELVLDVGAYTGIYSMVAAADSGANIIAFEPNPEALPGLRRNLSANGFRQVAVVEAAVSDIAGTAVLSVPADTTAASIDDRPNPSGVSVDLTTIDAVVGSRRVGLIKLDVEGHETAALRGAAATLHRDRPHIIVELLTPEAFADADAFLRGLGYDGGKHIGSDGIAETVGFVECGHPNFYFRR